MSENEQRTCSRCGTALAPDAPEGLCPRCLMALNLAAPTEAPGEEVGPHGTRVVPPPPEPPPPIAEIARHFPQLEILACLGRGGMGVVYQARQPRLTRLVALKLLAREKEKDTRFAERFTREAQALARLNHQNIVTVYDFGETDGLYYLLMEYVDGMNLRQLLQSRKLDPAEALGIVPAICDALQYAHNQGIVHRDIKPENILLDRQGRVKIADFGIAKLLGAAGPAEALTGEQQVVGTPHYMAPEQVEKPGTVDHRADIFSLGVVFYEMLTGELPLGKFAPPSRKVQVDVRLDEVVLHALEKEPARRYQQASEVRTDVDRISKSEPASAPPASAPGPGVPPPLESPAQSAWRQVKGPAIGLIITGVLNWLAVPLLLLLELARFNGRVGIPFVLLGVLLMNLVLGSLMVVAGLTMKRLQAYPLAIAASLLAILTTPGNLLGLPLGIWALVVLCQRHVRQAFGQGYTPAMFEPARPAPGSGAWKVALVIAAAVLLPLALVVGALLLAIAVPSYQRARVRVAELQQAQAQAAEAQQAQARAAAAEFQQQLMAAQRRAALSPQLLVVNGTVADARTGKPIPGARVEERTSPNHPFSSPPQSTTTDVQGHYVLTVLGDHALAASAPGYQTLFHAVPGLQKPEAGPVLLDFPLQPDQAPERAAGRQRLRATLQSWASNAPICRVHGTVTDAVTGKPVPSARLEVNPAEPPMPPTSTDAQGHYELRLTVRQGTVVSAPGYQTTGSPLGFGTHLADGTVQLDFQLQPAPAQTNAAQVRGATMAAGTSLGPFIGDVTVRGTVTDALSGKPIPGAQLRVMVPASAFPPELRHGPQPLSTIDGWDRASTDAQGNYELRTRAVGSGFFLAASAPGYLPKDFPLLNAAGAVSADKKLQLDFPLQPVEAESK